MSIRVAIADDQGMVRAGLRSLLESEPDLDVVAEAADGRAAVAVTHRHKPDVVLMDIRMPVLDGLAATRQIIAEGSTARVLVLTTFDLDEYVFEALRAGASGFLLKDATAEHLLAATAPSPRAIACSIRPSPAGWSTPSYPSAPPPVSAQPATTMP